MRRRNRVLNFLSITALQLDPRDRVLEVGYGSGDTLRQLAEVVNQGQVCGVDRSMEMLHAAARRTSRTRANAYVLRGDVSWLPWKDKAFDKVLCVNGITEWPCTRSGLEEIHRVLFPGGVLVISEHVSKQMTHSKAYGLAHLLSVVGFEDLEVMLIPTQKGEALILRAVRS